MDSWNSIPSTENKKADKVSPEALVTSENRHLLDLDTVGT